MLIWCARTYRTGLIPGLTHLVREMQTPPARDCRDRPLKAGYDHADAQTVARLQRLDPAE